MVFAFLLKQGQKWHFDGAGSVVPVLRAVLVRNTDPVVSKVHKLGESRLCSEISADHMVIYSAGSVVLVSQSIAVP